MIWEETLLKVKGARYIATASFALLILGFLLDVSTSHQLVVAITYNIPIALSSLALSRRLTLVLVVLALLANLTAGFINALAEGGADITAASNRGLAALSFLLVGFLTLKLRDATSRITTLRLGEARAKREHELRRMLTDLSGPLRPEAFLEQACRSLCGLLEADAVVVSATSDNRFSGPRYCHPPLVDFAKEGDEVPRFANATPIDRLAVTNSSVDATRLTVGRWQRQSEPDMMVVAVKATAADATTLLEEALHSLEPLLARAVLLQDLDHQRTELTRRNAVIRDLVYAFSHDLRTPLMANAMNMQLALDGAFGELSQEFRQTLRNGLEANEDLLDLADSLLLVARYESGETPDKPETINLASLLNQALARIAPVFEARALRVEVEAPDRLTALGRPVELRRVFQNLLDNAAKFSTEGALIEVRLDNGTGPTSAHGVRLEVLDRGSGIPARERETLFQRFSSGKAGGGTGLGLYLAHQIIARHGGTILYQPREGGGSCFSVWLPLGSEVVAA